MKKYLGCLAMILVGCTQNPIPDGAKLDQDQSEPRRFEQNERVTNQTVTPPIPLGLDLPDSMPFFEGTESKFRVHYWVEPGRPFDFTITGLPEGATYDDKTFELKWKPGFFTANLNEDPTVRTRNYEIVVRVATTDAERYEMVREATLVVQDTPRENPLSIIEQGHPGVDVDPSELYVMEGDEAKTYQFEISIPDSYDPEWLSKATVQIEEMPNMVSLRKMKTESNRILLNLEMKSDFRTATLSNVREVTVGNRIVRAKSFQFNLSLHLPSQRVYQYPLTLNFIDKRQPPALTLPTKVNCARTSCTVTASAVDPNAEVTPRIELIQTGLPPEMKDFTENRDVKPENNFSALQVRWRRVRNTPNLVPLRFKVCIPLKKEEVKIEQFTKCEMKTSFLQFVRDTLETPVVDRRDWELGAKKNMRQNDFLQIALPIEDAAAPREVKPLVTWNLAGSSELKGVSWNNALQILTLSNLPVGLHTLQMDVEGYSGARISEVFLFEVYPDQRARQVVLADSLQDPEALANLTLIKGAKLLPYDQDRVGELGLLRDTLLVGTGILKQTQTLPGVIQIIHSARDAILLSRFVSNVSESFGVKAKEIPLTSPSDWKLKPAKTNGLLTEPAKDYRLKGTLNPSSTSITSFESANGCEPMFYLEGISETVLVCVRCKKDYGVVVLSGVEFADLQIEPTWTDEEKELPAKWLKEVLQ